MSKQCLYYLLTKQYEAFSKIMVFHMTSTVCNVLYIDIVDYCIISTYRYCRVDSIMFVICYSLIVPCGDCPEPRAGIHNVICA